MQCLSRRESLCLPLVGFRLHKAGRDLCGSCLAQVPWKVKNFPSQNGWEAAELAFFLTILHLVFEVYNGDSNSITMDMGNGGNVSTGVFLFSAPKGVLVKCAGVRPCDYFAPFLFLGRFYIH